MTIKKNAIMVENRMAVWSAENKATSTIYIYNQEVRIVFDV